MASGVDWKNCFSVAPESSYPMHPGWQCDFYFGYGLGIFMPFSTWFFNFDLDRLILWLPVTPTFKLATFLL